MTLRFGSVLFAYMRLESYVSWFEKRPCTIVPYFAIPDDHDAAPYYYVGINPTTHWNILILGDTCHNISGITGPRESSRRLGKEIHLTRSLPRSKVRSRVKVVRLSIFDVRCQYSYGGIFPS